MGANLDRGSANYVQLSGTIVRAPTTETVGDVEVSRVLLLLTGAEPIEVIVVGVNDRATYLMRRMVGARLVVFGRLARSRSGELVVRADWMEECF